MAKASSDALIGVYIQMRDKKAALDTSTKEEKAEITANMDKIETELMKRLKADGVKSLKTPSGTPFTSKAEFIAIENFNEFLGFLVKSILDADSAVSHVEGYEVDEDRIKNVLDNADLQYLNKVVNKKACLDYMEDEETKGKLPPGIKYSSEIQLNVRK